MQLQGQTDGIGIVVSFDTRACQENRDENGPWMKVFSQGNFDYDPAGNVDSVDFDLFISQYGRSVPGATILSVRENPVAGPALFASMPLRGEKGEPDLL